jgi:hypothetical protein
MFGAEIKFKLKYLLAYNEKNINIPPAIRPLSLNKNRGPYTLPSEVRLANQGIALEEW